MLTTFRLVVKMEDLGYPLNIVQLVDSYLRARHVTVNVTCRMTGVPQGHVLGPHLFAVYTAYIPRQKGTILTQYVDDTIKSSRFSAS